MSVKGRFAPLTYVTLYTISPDCRLVSRAEVCVCSHVCADARVCKRWRPDSDIGCLPQSLTTLSFETGSAIHLELGVSQSGWPLNSRTVPAPAGIAAGRRPASLLCERQGFELVLSSAAGSLST